MKISKPKIFLSLPLALLSLEAYFGIIFGYFSAKFFSKKIPSFTFNIGNWRLHFHHWLIGLGILVSAFHYNFFPLSQFSFGFLGGLIFHGIYCYSDWYKILSKQKRAV